MDRPVEITRSYAECKFCNDIADMCNEIPDCILTVRIEKEHG